MLRVQMQPKEKEQAPCRSQPPEQTDQDKRALGLKEKESETQSGTLAQDSEQGLLTGEKLPWGGFGGTAA